MAERKTGLCANLKIKRKGKDYVSRVKLNTEEKGRVKEEKKDYSRFAHYLVEYKDKEKPDNNISISMFNAKKRAVYDWNMRKLPLEEGGKKWEVRYFPDHPEAWEHHPEAWEPKKPSEVPDAIIRKNLKTKHWN